MPWRSMVWLLLAVATSASAAEGTGPAAAWLEELGVEELFCWPLGRRAAPGPVAAIQHRDEVDFELPKRRLLLVGDSAAARDAVRAALRWFYTDPSAAPVRETVLLSAIPHLHGERLRPEGVHYPPTLPAYVAEDPATQYAWRWIGMQAPDLVVEVQSGERRQWYAAAGTPVASGPLATTLQAAEAPAAYALVHGLAQQAPARVGPIPALGVSTEGNAGGRFLRELLAAWGGEEAAVSAARTALQARLAREPLAVSRQLAAVYGRDLSAVSYIPALALIGKLQLSELSADDRYEQEVQRAVKSYADGKRMSSPTTGSALAGHLIFAALADRSEDASRRARWIELAQQASELGFNREGEPAAVMPFHSEMSDAIFMGGPILAQVGRLTKEARYFELCHRHLVFMRRLVLREDGLYRHSPLCETAWGRGNGFPALGLSLCLEFWPSAAPGREELQEWLRDHLRALVKHQDASGCWHQIIDRPESYRELSSTCMITYALARGVRGKWLAEEEFGVPLRRAWQAIKLRVGTDGQLVDVCTGTGKQENAEAYYRRAAILGKDPRGGAMALLVANEMVRYFAR